MLLTRKPVLLFFEPRGLLLFLLCVLGVFAVRFIFFWDYDYVHIRRADP